MLSDRHGARWVAPSGYGIARTVLALLPLVNSDSDGHVVLLCVLITVLGRPSSAFLYFFILNFPGSSGSWYNTRLTSIYALLSHC